LILTYPQHNVEGIFELTKILKEFPFNGDVLMTCVKSTCDFMTGNKIMSKHKVASHKMTLKSGKVLKLSDHKDHYQGHDVHYTQLGD
jgi:hypothetical protein